VYAQGLPTLEGLPQTKYLSEVWQPLIGISEKRRLCMAGPSL
jgi:hypothetical protein